jgi:calcium-dependent protein kinase
VPTALIKEDEILREGVLEEIKILKKLNSPNIVKLHDAIIQDDNYYIVYEYCEGKDF